MRTLTRNKRVFYLCRRNPASASVKTFVTPVTISANFDIARSEVDIMTFGENYMNYARSNVDNVVGGLFTRGDRIYLTEPSPFNSLCNDADYEVDGVLPSINNTEIVYNRLSGSNVT